MQPIISILLLHPNFQRRPAHAMALPAIRNGFRALTDPLVFAFPSKVPLVSPAHTFSPEIRFLCWLTNRRYLPMAVGVIHKPFARLATPSTFASPSFVLHCPKQEHLLAPLQLLSRRSSSLDILMKWKSLQRPAHFAALW